MGSTIWEGTKFRKINIDMIAVLIPCYSESKTIEKGYR